MPENSLKDQRVLITGGAGFLGTELVKAFSSCGAKVAISKKGTGTFFQKKGACPLFQADIRDIGQIEKLVVSATESLGGLDILINNAAIFGRTPIENVTLEQWNDLIDINLRAPFFLAKACLPFLRKPGKGRIINIADTYGASPSAGFVPYGVSKAGLIAMTKGLAKELAPDVLVNCVCPGIVDSGEQLAVSSQQKTSHESRVTSDEKAIDATLLKRPVTIDDVIKTVLFIAENNSMTGQTVFVDCGRWV